MGWKFKSALLALMLLGACANGTDGGGFHLAMPKPAPKQIAISGKDVIIAGPKGFCIDPTITKNDGSDVFILLGSCAAIAASSLKPRPKIPAILTATVSQKTQSAPIAESIKTLTRFFKSDAGRAALSRDGRADTVSVMETLNEDGVFYIHARDTSTGTMAGAGDEYWRALFDVNGRIVSASVFGLKSQPFSAKEGYDTLQAFTNQIKRKSGPKSGPAIPSIPFLDKLFKKDPV